MTPCATKWHACRRLPTPDLQDIICEIVIVSEEYGLFINNSKTKVMTFSKQPPINNITINNSLIQKVQNFKYLETNVNINSTSEIEVKSTIEQARIAFINLRTFFVRNITLVWI